MTQNTEPELPTYEYCIRYCAGSNISFHNERDAEWREWDGPGETEQEILEYLHGTGTGPINIPEGLNEALEISGFEWWPEVRVAGGDDD